MQGYCDVYKWTILKRTLPEVKCLHPKLSRRGTCTSSVSNVIYNNFSYGAAFYMLNGKNVGTVVFVDHLNTDCKKKTNSFKHYLTVKPSLVFLYTSFSLFSNSVLATLHISSVISHTLQILCIGIDRSQQTVQTKIRLLLKKQSGQGLRCLPFHQHLLDALIQCYIQLFYF